MRFLVDLISLVMMFFWIGPATAQAGEINVRPEIKFDDSKYLGASQVESVAYFYVAAYTQEVINAYEQEFNKQMGLPIAAPTFEFYRAQNSQMLTRFKQAKGSIRAVGSVKSGALLKLMHERLTKYIESLLNLTTLLNQKEYRGWQGEAGKQMADLEEKIKTLEEQVKLAVEKSGQVSDLRARVQSKEAEILSTLAEAQRLDKILWLALGVAGLSLLVSLVRFVKS